MEFLRREPVLVAAVIRALIAVAVAYGFEIPAETVALVYVAAEALLGVPVRQKVTPYVGEVKDVLGDDRL